MFGEETKLKESAKDALRGYFGMNYIEVIILNFLVVFRTCQSIHCAGKKWRLNILPQYTVPCEPNTANRHMPYFMAKFAPVLTILCMLGLKLLKLFCVFI